jgi:YD repeat-containing protein
VLAIALNHRGGTIRRARLRDDVCPADPIKPLNRRFQVANRLNQTTSYAYSTAGLLNSVTDPLANQTELFYDFTGRVSSVEQACGGTTALQAFYTAGLPDLSVVGYDAAHPAPMLSAAGALEYQEDERGNPTQIVRDHFGNVLQETNALGHVTTYQRDAHGRVTKMTHADPDGAGPLGDLITLFEYEESEKGTFYFLATRGRFKCLPDCPPVTTPPATC